MLVRQQLHQVALDRGLRESTLRSYEGMLRRAGLLDREADSVSLSEALELAWELPNPNVRRSFVICLRSVLGLEVKVPRGVPRRYDLPSEDTLRLAFMQSRKYETRFLLMAFAGLRVGEACAVTGRDVSGDRLTVDKQVVELYRTGQPRSVRIGPGKSAAADVTVPWWLAERTASLRDTVVPSNVRNVLLWCGKRVGVRLNPHQLRHWYATTLLERGAPLALVSRQMRHSDVSVTLRTYAEFRESQIHEIF